MAQGVVYCTGGRPAWQRQAVPAPQKMENTREARQLAAAHPLLRLGGMHVTAAYLGMAQALGMQHHHGAYLLPNEAAVSDAAVARAAYAVQMSGPLQPMRV